MLRIDDDVATWDPETIEGIAKLFIAAANDGTIPATARGQSAIEYVLSVLTTLYNPREDSDEPKTITDMKDLAASLVFMLRADLPGIQDNEEVRGSLTRALAHIRAAMTAAEEQV